MANGPSSKWDGTGTLQTWNDTCCVQARLDQEFFLQSMTRLEMG